MARKLEILYTSIILILGESGYVEVGGIFEGVYGHLFSSVDDLSWHVWLKHTVSNSNKVAARKILFGLSWAPKTFEGDRASN